MSSGAKTVAKTGVPADVEDVSKPLKSAPEDAYYYAPGSVQIPTGGVDSSDPANSSTVSDLSRAAAEATAARQQGAKTAAKNEKFSSPQLIGTDLDYYSEEDEVNKLPNFARWFWTVFMVSFGLGGLIAAGVWLWLRYGVPKVSVGGKNDGRHPAGVAKVGGRPRNAAAFLAVEREDGGFLQ